MPNSPCHRRAVSVLEDVARCLDTHHPPRDPQSHPKTPTYPPMAPTLAPECGTLSPVCTHCGTLCGPPPQSDPAGHTTHHTLLVTPHNTTAGHNAPHLLRRQHGRTHYVPHTNTGTDQKNIQILDRAQVKYHITNIQKLPAQLLQIL